MIQRVEVRWYDATLDTDEQGKQEELKDEIASAQEMTTIGYLLGQGKNLRLAFEFGMEAGEPVYRSIQRIPTGMVLSITPLGPAVSSTVKGRSTSSAQGTRRGTGSRSR